MPSLTFVMPHWLYWAGLIIFPAIAIVPGPRQMRHPLPPGPSLFIAYLFWLCSGFMGIHRFYLRSACGFVFIPVFLAILYCNVAGPRSPRRHVAHLRRARAGEYRGGTGQAAIGDAHARGGCAVRARPGRRQAERSRSGGRPGGDRSMAIAGAMERYRDGRPAADRRRAAARPRAQAAGAGGRPRPELPPSRSPMRFRRCMKQASARTRRCICTRDSPTRSNGSTSGPANTSPGGR